MLNGFPLPDFNFGTPPSSPPANCPSSKSQEMSDAEYDSLCTRKGLVVDQSTPIKCTPNSTVYAARSPRDGQKWAIKVTPNKRRIGEEYTKRQQLRDSPYLLKSVSFHQSPTKAMIQMELCELGDLHNVMLEEPDIWQLIHDIGTALAILHGDDWIHLDVSPGNILIGQSCFKLADFGTLTKIGEFEVGLEGAGPYVSPEVLNFPNGADVTGQTDVFSFGLVLFEVTTGVKVPRGGSANYMAARTGRMKLGSGDYACEASEHLQAVVNSMVRPDPCERPTPEQLVDIATQELANLPRA